MKKVRKTSSTLKVLGPIFEEISKEGLSRYPLLAVFYTGTEKPNDCILMERTLVAETGFVFAGDFASRHAKAIALDDSFHDGAVLFGRASINEDYVCTGWSYRIASRGVVPDATPNRGSAYNSAISLSVSARVDCVLLAASTGFEVFCEGRGEAVGRDSLKLLR